MPADDGAQVITLQVCDDDEPARCGTDSRTVTATNVAPAVVAAPDVVTDTGTVSIDPIATYSDPGSADTHTAVIDWGDGSVADGPAAVTGGGVVGTHTYLSNGVFTVQVCVTDDDGGTACDALQVTVAGVENLAPTAFSAEFDIESPTTALVLGGFDAELATLSFAVATGPLNGNVSLDGPVTCDGFGTCTRPATYTPDPGSTGNDSFTFTVFDGTTTSAPATVTLIGNRPPEPGTPFVQPERAIGPTTLTVRVADPDGDPLTVTLGTGPEHGVLGALSAPSCTVEDDGSSSCAVTVLYTPEAGFVGIDQFTIVVDDGVNAPETLFVAIRVGNTAPIAKTDVIITDPGTAGSVDVLGNDRDADGDLLTLDAVGDAAHGEVSCVEDSGPIVCTYTPDAGYTGGDEFTYTIADGFGATATATVEVTVHSGGSGVEPTDCPTVASALDGGMVAGEHWVACSSPTANGIAP